MLLRQTVELNFEFNFTARGEDDMDDPTALDVVDTDLDSITLNGELYSSIEFIKEFGVPAFVNTMKMAIKKSTDDWKEQ